LRSIASIATPLCAVTALALAVAVSPKAAPGSASPLKLTATARSTWTATADSQELVAENGAASNVLDGNVNTIWHTQYRNAVAPLPHWIAIDTKAVQPWAGLVYTPRLASVSPNGRVGQYQIDVSNDGTTWSANPVAQYYGASAVGTSTADAIWVLAWSETRDDITLQERRALGFGGHALATRLDFGARLSAQLWIRPVGS